MAILTKMANLVKMSNIAKVHRRHPLKSGNFGEYGENDEFDKNGESGENFAIGLANIQIGLLKGSLGLSILSKMANPVKIPKMRKLARGHLQNINVTRLALHNP